MNIRPYIMLFGILFLTSSISHTKETSSVISQVDDSLNKVATVPALLEEIGSLESKSDAKCYATANRLESFMYGTPLSAEARYKKVELQKQLVFSLWQKASQNPAKKPQEPITSDEMEKLFDEILYLSRNSENAVIIDLDTDMILITATEMRQYGSIAYSLRAILSLQQDIMLNPDIDLRPLHRDTIGVIKDYLDVYTLATLNLADRAASNAGESEISDEAFEYTWDQIGLYANKEVSLPKKEVGFKNFPSSNDRARQFISDIIEKKKMAYKTYNNLSRKSYLQQKFGFIRNHFAKIPMPKGTRGSVVLTKIHGNYVVEFARNMLEISGSIAFENKRSIIRAKDVENFIHKYMPHIVTDQEDVHYLNKSASEVWVEIESYDLDAYRDFADHWTLFSKAAHQLYDEGFNYEIDPFAAEIIAENIAQYAVLLWRVAGTMISPPQSNADQAKNSPPNVMNVPRLKMAKKMIEKEMTVQGEKIPKKPQVRAYEYAVGQIVSAPEDTSKKWQTSYFENMTESVGLNFSHKMAPWKVENIKNTEDKSIRFKIFHGPGAAAGDVNNDGWPDVLLVSPHGNALYLNNGKGRFIDATESSGLLIDHDHQINGEPFQPLIADLDNDGWQDILITYAYNTHKVYRNKGDGTFEDISKKCNFGSKLKPATAAAVFDFDNDGLLDIYICNFGDYVGFKEQKRRQLTRKQKTEDTVEMSAAQTKEDAGAPPVAPLIRRDSRNAMKNTLLRNTGNFVFEDITDKSKAGDMGWANAVSHTDFNRDGYQDLIVANDFGHNTLLMNNKGEYFTNVSKKYGFFKHYNSMNVGFADLNQDSFPDIYVSNINMFVKDEKYTFPNENMPMRFSDNAMATMRYRQSSLLFMSDATDDKLQRYKVSADVGGRTASVGWAWDADFFDFDNDTDDDLYVVNGYNYYRQSLQAPLATLEQSSISSIKKDKSKRPSKPKKTRLERQTNFLLVNNNGRLANQSAQSGAEIAGFGSSAVYLDFDNDGDLDIVTTNYDGPAFFLMNRAEGLNHNWIKIKLIGDPGQGSNRDAIGARIFFHLPDGRKIWREIHGGGGYCSMELKEQHAGLQNLEKVKVEVLWPNGQSKVYDDVAANQSYLIDQSTGRISVSNKSRANLS